MAKTALIDLGTNAVRLLIVELEGDGSCAEVLREKQPVSLGENSFAERLLTEAAMERTVAALEDMVKTARSFQTDEIRAVATSAVRDAENRDAFLARVENKTGLRLKVVSGLEEARLIYQGVARNINLGEDPGLLMDIGGGSMELIIGSRRAYYELDSLPLGVARLAERFNLAARGGRVDRRTYQAMGDYALSHSRHFAAKARTYDLAYCYGGSGTIENLVRVSARRHNPLAEARAYPPLTLSALRELAEWLGPMTSQERKGVDGLEARKAELIMAGCATLEALLTVLGLNAIRSMEYGLKHGLIADLVRDRLGAPDGVPDPREASVRRLGRRLRYDESHAEATAALALLIHDFLAGEGLLETGPRERELLRLAALLHDVGKFVDYRNHHLHSHYLIKNSALLGFNDDEIDFMAFLALSHRKKKRAGQPREPYGDEGPRARGNRLGFILRLAEILDSRRRGIPAALSLERGKGGVVFLFRGEPGAFDLEMEALKKNAKTFQNLFGRPLAAALKSRRAERPFD